MYSYDASGNRITETHIANAKEVYGTVSTSVSQYTYDANNRLTSLSSGGVTNTYTYDDNGNMLSDGSKTFSYNALNQLVTFTNGPVTASYTYLANGLRESKTVSEGTNTAYSAFAWDGDALLYEYEATNTSTPSPYICTVYNYGHGLISHSDNLNGNYILYAKNAHGDIIDLLDAADELGTLEQNQFDAFGNGGANNYSRMGYAGQYHDYETGFIYLRARYYNPAIGRFINEDPIRDGLNWYVYCNNNPVNLIDLLGLAPTVEEAALMASHIYDHDLGSGEVDREVAGWILVGIMHGRESMKAGLYIPIGDDPTNPSEYAVVFKGTTMDNATNWKNNIEAFFSNNSADMWDSIFLAKGIVELYGNNVTFIGHSKGGGEAIAAATATNSSGITFNAANFNFSSYGLKYGDSLKVQNYYVKNEVLSSVLGYSSFGKTMPLLAEQPHITYEFIGTFEFTIPDYIGNHMISSVIKSIGR